MSSQRNREIEVTTAGRVNLLPQTSMMDTSDGPMPMQEEVRLDVAELSTQAAKGHQECLTSIRDLTQPIPYEGKYHSCVWYYLQKHLYAVLEYFPKLSFLGRFELFPD